MIFALLVQLFPAVTFAEDDFVDEYTEILLFALEKDGQIALYENEFAEKVLTYIPDSTSVELLDLGEEYSQVLFLPLDEEENSALVGFVQTIHIVNPQDVEEFLQKRDNEDIVLEEYEENDIEESITNEELDEAPELTDNPKSRIQNEKPLEEMTELEIEIDKSTTVETQVENQPITKHIASLSTFSNYYFARRGTQYFNKSLLRDVNGIFCFEIL